MSSCLGNGLLETVHRPDQSLPNEGRGDHGSCRDCQPADRGSSSEMVERISAVAEDRLGVKVEGEEAEDDPGQPGRTELAGRELRHGD